MFVRRRARALPAVTAAADGCPSEIDSQTPPVRFHRRLLRLGSSGLSHSIRSKHGAQAAQSILRNQSTGTSLGGHPLKAAGSACGSLPPVAMNFRSASAVGKAIPFRNQELRPEWANCRSVLCGVGNLRSSGCSAGPAAGAEELLRLSHSRPATTGRPASLQVSTYRHRRQ